MGWTRLGSYRYLTAAFILLFYCFTPILVWVLTSVQLLVMLQENFTRISFYHVHKKVVSIFQLFQLSFSTNYSIFLHSVYPLYRKAKLWTCSTLFQCTITFNHLIHYMNQVTWYLHTTGNWLILPSVCVLWRCPRFSAPSLATLTLTRPLCLCISYAPPSYPRMPRPLPLARSSPLMEWVLFENRPALYFF